MIYRDSNKLGRGKLSPVVVVLLLLYSVTAAAVIETYEFSDPQLAKRYFAMSAELRCPKCQNQTIADSNSPIAQDLRAQLHQQLEAGASDEEILQYMVARYGEFVRYKPAYRGYGVILWLAPAVLLLLAVFVVLGVIRGQRRLVERSGSSQGALSPQERAKLDALLDEKSEDQPVDTAVDTDKGNS